MPWYNLVLRPLNFFPCPELVRKSMWKGRTNETKSDPALYLIWGVGLPPKRMYQECGKRRVDFQSSGAIKARWCSCAATTAIANHPTSDWDQPCSLNQMAWRHKRLSMSFLVDINKLYLYNMSALSSWKIPRYPTVPRLSSNLLRVNPSTKGTLNPCHMLAFSI